MGKNKRFTKEQKEFLLEMLLYKQPQEICNLFYKKFNRKICVGTINNYKCRYNKDRKQYKKCKLNDNQKKWLLNMLPYRDNIEAIEIFKNKFGIELTEFNLRNFRNKYKVKRVYKQKIRNTKFREKIKKPLYNEIHGPKADYIRIENRKYQVKRRFVWEQYHGRKIPKDYEVIFLDNNKTNYDIHNLALIKKSTRFFLLKKGIVPCNKDIIKTADLILNLEKKNKIKKKEYRDMWLKDIFKKEKEKEYKSMSLYEEALEKCKNNEEMWVEVKDYPKYEVSNLGNCRNKKNKLMIGYKDKTENTMKVQLQNEKGTKRTTMANIVAKNFELPNPYNLRYARNIDENKYNCRLDNLSWTTNLKKRDEMLFDEEVEYSDKDRIDKELANTKIEVKETPEVWKDVVNYERWYEVSNKGNVRRIELDGTRTLLKSTYTDGRARSVGLRMTGPTKSYTIKYLVAQAFNIKPTSDNNRIIYNIDGDLSNDCSYNLTYDRTQTEEYIKEQEKIKAEREEKEKLEQEKQNNKEELLNYIDNNKEFLLQAKEMNKEITLRDIYDKLNELIEVIKNANK